MVNILLGNSDKLEEKKFLNEKNETKENIDKTLKNKSFKKIIIEKFDLDEEDLADEDIQKIFDFFEDYSENDEKLKKGIIYFGEKINFEKKFLVKTFFESIKSKKISFFFIEYVLFYKIYGEEKIEKIFDFLKIDLIDFFDRIFFIDLKNFLKSEESEQIVDYFLETFPKIDEKIFYEEDFLEVFRNFIFYFKLKDKIILNEEKGFEENIKKYGKNIGLNIPENFSSIRDKNIIPNHEIADFLYKWIFGSNYIFTLQNLSKFDFSSIYAYLLKYKKKSFRDVLDILYFSYKYDFEFDYDDFNELEKLLEEKDYDGLLKFSEKFDFGKKSKKQLENAFSHKNDEIIYKILGEKILAEFEKFYKYGILETIFYNSYYDEWDKFLKDVFPEKINEKDFLECAKICLNPSFNREKGIEILEKYLKGDFEKLENLEIYNTNKNKKWLKNFLSKKQTKIWLSKNREEFDIFNSGKFTLEKLYDELAKNLYNACVIINKINGIGFDLKEYFENYFDFEEYFSNPLNKEFIRFKRFCSFENRGAKNWEFGKNLLEELFKKIDKINYLMDRESEIKNLNKNFGEVRKIKKVIIEKELNPLRMLQMGNFVDGSCLSYYNANGYYYSAITNTIDVNKGIFYIYDENEELIGRVLVTIGNDKKLTRYKMYYKGKVNISLNEYFDEYFKNLAEKMGMEINGSEDEVQLIESEDWYKDGEYFVK